MAGPLADDRAVATIRIGHNVASLQVPAVSRLRDEDVVVLRMNNVGLSSDLSSLHCLWNKKYHAEAMQMKLRMKMAT